MKYSKFLNRLKTPQSRAIPFSSQVMNSAGGFAWEANRWDMLDRFLILGTETGTYYVGEKELTLTHAENVLKAIQEDGKRVVQRIVVISHEGRAPKNDPAIYALAMAASFGNEETRAEALNAVPLVCRTASHLFAFAEASNGMRGWGRGLRRAIGNWYTSRVDEDLAYQLVKYQTRSGWSNRDLLRLSHPKPASETQKALLSWAVSGELVGESELIQAVLSLGGLSAAEAAASIRKHRIPRESVPTELLTSAEVWEALLEHMPLTAMIRNLATMTRIGLLDGPSEATQKVVAELKNADRIRRARVHPLTILTALMTYQGGKGLRSDAEWRPNSRVIDALDKAFYLAFENVEPTGKQFVLGLDVSGSMVGTKVAGSSTLSCRSASAAMALVTEATEDAVTHLAFDTNVYNLSFSRRSRLDDVVSRLERTGGGGTDCSAPIRYATKKRIKADVFVIYTDSETWSGAMHPAQAMEEYRQKMGIPAKLIVVAMASSKASIADPRDGRSLDIVGFDTSVPQVIAEFIR